MQKILLILLLIVPLTNTLAQSLSDEEAISLIKEVVEQEPREIYSVSMSDSLKDFVVKEVVILKRGKFKKEKNYWPIRARVKGKALVIRWGNSNPLWAKKEIDDFDKIIDTRLNTNDYDEWKVNILSVKRTIDSGNKSAIEALIAKDGIALKGASNEVKQNKKIVLSAVTNNWRALKYADISLKMDKDVVLAALRNDIRTENIMGNYLLNDKSFVLEALKLGATSFYKDLNVNLRKNKEMAKLAIQSYAANLEFVDENLKGDKELVLIAVSKIAHTLKYASSNLRDDAEVILAGLKHSTPAIEYASNRLRSDKEFMLQAVKLNGLALEFASETLKKDKDVVLAAINNRAYALEFADDKFKKDKTMVLIAVKKFGRAIKFAHSSLKKNKDILRASKE